MQTFAILSGIASILGVGFSAWAAVGVYRLRLRYRRMDLLPRRIERLEGHTRTLTELLRVHSDDPSVFADETVQLDATLASLAKLLDRNNRQEVTRVQRHIVHRRPVTSQEQVRSIRTATNRLIVILRTNLEEDKWA